jgi:pyrimidine-nucleoside phosphorylase
MKYHVTDIIRKKRAGESLSPAELRFLIEGYLNGSIKDYHLAAFLMAVCFQGMVPAEMREWARLMWHSGITFAREHRDDFWIDKHSTGGVGDKTSLILVPLVHCVAERVLGSGKVRIPMISGRGLDFSGGTLDKLDSIPGFSSQLPIDRALAQLRQYGFFMMGQTADLAPADRLLYALRDVTGTTDCLPLIVSSILSKKFAENLDGLVIDVKFGAGAFMSTLEQGRTLARALTETAQAEGVRATAVLTPMHEPLGWKVGNQLEVEECADFISGTEREAGLLEVTLTLAAEMLALASRGALTADQARAECEKELQGKQVYSAFVRMFELQGGRWDAFEKRRKILENRPRYSVMAPQGGVLSRLDALAIAKLVRSMGGGRQSKESGIDFDVGVIVHKKVGDTVRSGETVFDMVLSTERTVDVGPVLATDFISVQPTAARPRWIEEVIRA